MIYELSLEGRIHFFESGITKCEMNVLELLFQIDCNERIAAKLFVTKKTVAYHLTKIFQRLHCRNRVELMIKFKKYYIETEEEIKNTLDKDALPIGNVKI